MRHKAEYLLQEVAELYVVVPVGTEAMNFNGVISFNESGALLWKLLDFDTDKAALTRALTKEYEVSAADAERDVGRFLEKMDKAGLLADD